MLKGEIFKSKGVGKMIRAYIVAQQHLLLMLSFKQCLLKELFVPKHFYECLCLDDTGLASKALKIMLGGRNSCFFRFFCRNFWC